MLTIKKVLFPTDFSESANTALKWALMIAKNFEAELHMLHAVVLHNDDVGDEVMERFPDLEKCQSLLEENADTKLEKALPDKGVLDIRRHVTRGVSADSEIARFAEENDIDLVVMGTHGRSGLRHLLLGSITERVLRHLHTPMLTIRDSKRYTHKTDVERLIIPLDFSEHSKQSAAAGVTLASMLDADVEFVHVVDRAVHPAFYSIGRESASEIDRELEDRIVTNMQKFVGELAGDLDTTYTVADGNPAREIAQLADSHTNALIVIASHGSGALERLMIGSTTERVIRSAGSPVLTIRSEIEE